MKHIVKLPDPSINGQDRDKEWSNCHFVEDTVLYKSPKTLIIVLIKSLVNWYEVSRRFCQTSLVDPVVQEVLKTIRLDENKTFEKLLNSILL